MCDVSINMLRVSDSNPDLLATLPNIKLQRPMTAYVGKTRAISVLMDKEQYFSLLSAEGHQACKANEGLSLSVVVRDGQDTELYPVLQTSLLAAAAWLCVKMQYLDPATLVPDPQPVLYEDVTVNMQAQLLALMNNETKTFRRTAAVAHTFPFCQGADSSISAQVYEGVVIKGSDTHLFRRLVVQCGTRKGILRTFISSKKLTSTHMMALVEFDEDAFDFITVSSKQQNIVPTTPL